MRAADFLVDDAMVQELCSVPGHQKLRRTPHASPHGSDGLGNEASAASLNEVFVSSPGMWLRCSLSSWSL